MATYNAATATITLEPSARGFHAKAERLVSGLTVKVTPDFARWTAPRLPPIPVNVQPNIDNTALARIEQALRAIPKIELDADSTPAQQKLAELRARLETLRAQVINLEVSDGQAKAEIALVKRELDVLDTMTPEIDVKVDAAAASAALGRVENEAARVDGKTPRMTVNVDTAQAISAIFAVIAATNGLDGRTASVNVAVQAAGAIASLALVATRAFALGGAVGAVSALGAAVAALGPAGAVAAGGLASAVLAFGGVGKALTALGAQQDSAGKDAQASAQKQAAAAQQVEAAQSRVAQAAQAASRARSDAAKNVARAEQQSAQQVASAQQSAARAIASAEKQAIAAHRALKQATTDLAREQGRLTAAWDAGRRSLQDLQDQVDGNALDQRQAAFDLKDAEKDLAEARAGGDVDQIARAQLAYDKQIETIDQLNKQTQRLGTDNAKAQAAGVAGTSEVVAANERIAAAQQRVNDSTVAAGEADAAVNQARIDGAASVAAAREAGEQRVADAREQGQRSIEAADQALLESQKALQQAMQQTADTASSSADAVKQAFANLSPAAATFARYLWSLKPALDQLRATAAAGLFPPLQAGLQTLMGQFGVFNTVVGQFASAIGNALKYVLEQLASPFWTSFFSTLGNVAGPIIGQLAVVFMQLAQAAAQVILALLPFTPAALAIVGLIAQLVSALAPFIGQLVGALLPAANAVLMALFPLGPVLAALGPILAVLAQAFSLVLGAVLQALAPILVALTPLIQQLAMAFATQLVTAIQNLTPFLVGLAQFMSEHPGLVLGVISVLTTLFGAWQAIRTAVGVLLGPLMLMRLATLALGISAATMGSMFGGAFATVAGLISRFISQFSFMALARTLIQGIGGAIMGIGRAVLTAMGPVGWIIMALGLMFASSEEFRGAVMGLLGVLGGALMQVLQALQPVFQSVMGVVSMIMGVFGALLAQVASALVPVLNMLAGVVGQLAMALLPPLVSVVQALVPVIGMFGQIVGLLFAAFQPVLGVFTQLISVLLPILAQIISSVVVPVISFLAQVFAGELTMVLQYVLMPALQALAWLLQNVVVPVIQWFASLVGPLFQGIGAVMVWLWQSVFVPAWNAIAAAVTWAWTNVLQPVISFIWEALKILGAIIGTVLVAPFVIAWNIIAAIVEAVWARLQVVWYGAIVPALQFLGSIFTWLWQNAVVPAWNGIVAAALWAWNNVLKPTWDLVMAGLRLVGSVFSWLWTNVVVPVWNGITGAITTAWNFIRDNIFNPIVNFLRATLGPIFTWLWNSVIVPVWAGIRGAIEAAYIFIRDNIFNPLKAAVQAVGQAFQNVSDWIGRAWATIREAARAPVQWVIDVVYNRGIMPVWNGIAGLFGLGKLNPIQMATGGVLPGYRPGSDTVPVMLSRGEGVLVPEAVRGLGPDFVGWANRTFSGGRSDGGAGTPQAGGRGYDMGFSLGGVLPRFADGGILGGVGDFFAGAAGFFTKVFTDPVGATKELFAKVVGDSDNNPGGPTFGPGNGKGGWTDALKAIPGKVIEATIKKVKEWIASMAAGGLGPLGAGAPFYVKEITRSALGHGMGGQGAMIGVATSIVETALKMYANRGVPASLGFPHDAVGSDHDSVGLFQQRQAGWGTLAERMNAFGSANLFFNKLARFNWRGMEPGAAAQKVQVSAFPGRYSGQMGRARGLVAQHTGVTFDQGGVANGLGFMLKNTIQPERVLSPAQTRSYDALAQAIGPTGVRIDGVNDGQGPGGTGAPLVGEYHSHFHGDNNEAVATRQLTHRLRVISQGGSA